jgi:hypothetical protein
MADNTLKVSTGISLKPQSTQPEGDAGTLYVDSASNELRVKQASGTSAPEQNISGDIDQLQTDVALLESGYSRRTAVSSIEASNVDPSGLADGRYILAIDGNTIDGAYTIAGIVKGDIFSVATGVPTKEVTPLVGYVTYVNDGNELDALYHEDGGPTWETRAAGGGASASAVTYSNGTSGLAATDVQAAIDEVEARVQDNDGKNTNVPTALSYTAATGVIGSDGTSATVTLADATNRGLMSNTDFSKLAAISGTNTGDEVDASETDKGIVELATSAETTAGLAVQASDTRLSDARTPTAHTHTASEITDFDTEVSNNVSVVANTNKVSADGSIDEHSDVDLTGASGADDGKVLEYTHGSGFALAAVAAGGISDIVEDITPQLGGDLDTNGKNISNADTTNRDITVTSASAAGASGLDGGNVIFKTGAGDGAGEDGSFAFQNGNNTHFGLMATIVEEGAGSESFIITIDEDLGAESAVFIEGSIGVNNDGGKAGLIAGSVETDSTSVSYTGGEINVLGGDVISTANFNHTAGSVLIKSGGDDGTSTAGDITSGDITLLVGQNYNSGLQGSIILDAASLDLVSPGFVQAHAAHLEFTKQKDNKHSIIMSDELDEMTVATPDQTTDDSAAHAIRTGSTSAGTGQSGLLTVMTGSSFGHQSGNLNLETGEAELDSGSILLRTGGSTSGEAGGINFQNGQSAFSGRLVAEDDFGDLFVAVSISENMDNVSSVVVEGSFVTDNTKSGGSAGVLGGSVEVASGTVRGGDAVIQSGGDDGSTGGDISSGDVVLLSSDALNAGTRGAVLIDTEVVKRGTSVYEAGTDFLEEEYIHAVTATATGDAIVTSFAKADFASVEIAYSMKSAVGARTGTIRIANDGTNFSVNDVSVETAAMATTFTVTDNAGELEVKALNTSGTDHTMRLDVKRIKS